MAFGVGAVGLKAGAGGVRQLQWGCRGKCSGMRFRCSGVWADAVGFQRQVLWGVKQVHLGFRCAWQP